MSERITRPNPARHRFDSTHSVILVVTVLAALCLPSIGIAKGPDEIDVKVAFLFNFALYLTWPEKTFSSADSPLVFGVLGDQKFFEIAKARLSGRTVRNRPIVIREYSALPESMEAHILFIGTSVESQGDEIRTAVGDLPIFMISDSDDFAAKGGTANFYDDRGRVRFALNLRIALQQRLTISSKLLRLAKLVE